VDEKTARLAVALSLEPKNLRALVDALADRVAVRTGQRPFFPIHAGLPTKRLDGRRRLKRSGI
jgi:hypothetical protein